MSKTPLSLERHREIAAILDNNKIVSMTVDVMNSTAMDSRVGRLAQRFNKLVGEYRSELENLCHKHGHGADAADTYYPIHNADGNVVPRRR